MSASFENEKFVLAVFFNLQKPYDTMWKCEVLRKLFSLAIIDTGTAVPDVVSCFLYIDDFVLYLSGSTLPSAVGCSWQ